MKKEGMITGMQRQSRLRKGLTGAAAARLAAEKHGERALWPL